MSSQKSHQKAHNDFGLSEKSQVSGFRSINKDGSFNIVKTNVPFLERYDIFHNLVSMPWYKFMGYILLGYMVINVIFGCVYYVIGVENLTGIHASNPMQEFVEAFFFSAQTITTLGYGRVAPIGLVANMVAAIESMLGLLSFALATGMLYGRFSKATSHIKYSDIAVVAPYQDINGFMLRIVNPKKNELVELSADLGVSFKKEDGVKRNFYSLALERSMVFFFPSVWTIVHPIDQESPLYGMTMDDFIENDAEFIIMLKAFDESTSQVVYSRSSYKASEIVWGAKFAYLGSRVKDKLHIDISRLNEHEAHELNTY